MSISIYRDIPVSFVSRSNRIPLSNMTRSLIICFIVSVIILLNGNLDVFAATDVWLSPASGTHTNNVSVNVMIDTNGADINGVDIRINYSGAVSFATGSQGNISVCNPTFIQGSGSVSLICFIPPGQIFNGQGSVGSLIFSATEEGQANLEVARVDVAGTDLGNTSGATYTMIVGGVGGIGGELPRTARRGYTIILIAVSVVLLSGLGFIIAPKLNKNNARTMVIYD